MPKIGNINNDSDNDASIVITDKVNADDFVEIKDIKTEIPSTSVDTDFLMDWSDTGNERNAEEIPFHYDPMDYSIDANEKKEELEFLFQFLLVESTKYEVISL